MPNDDDYDDDDLFGGAPNHWPLWSVHMSGEASSCCCCSVGKSLTNTNPNNQTTVDTVQINCENCN